ncbi:TnsA-like heteromeric transposase endonuclease subunit [Streptomyces sp. NPDC102451]|uniref:TnsA-like heteromeric transposase endonuclease subunit n=1 Tax=Streptomyces sp. NPDC102451 TaxID=3366177 RepID=UPI0038198D7B
MAVQSPARVRGKYEQPMASVRYDDASVRKVPFKGLRLADFTWSVPWRKFRSVHGQAHYSGRYASATMAGPVVYESRLELARLLLADMDPSVRGIYAQPCHLTARIGDRVRRHVPDFLLVMESGVVRVVNVKPADRLTDPKITEALAWPGELVERHGWEYEIWSGADRVVLENVRFLAAYRRPGVVPEAELERAWESVQDGDRLGVAERRLAAGRPDHEARPPLLALVWTWRQVDLSVLLAHPSTEFLVETSPAEPAAAALLGGLGSAEDDALTVRFRHVQEVRFGYQLGSSELALEGEPRPDYAPGMPLMHRYRAKAAELGVDPATVRRWVSKVEEAGPAGLVSKRQPKSVLDRADSRWLEMARTVIGGLEKSSRPVRGLVLMEIEERVAKKYGRDVVKVPKQTTGYELLKELSRGTNAFEGSTKGKRSIANRPQGVFGKLRATRPGEYIVLDTNSLDVFAMEPVTCRWVQCELTVAMDLYSKVITGLRLTPVSTKSIDVAGVLFETIRPREVASAGTGEPLPYCGVPSTVVFDAEKLVDAHGRPLLPAVAAETIIYDHGKIYVSNHIASVSAKLDISLQPARPYTPTEAGGTVVQDAEPGAAGGTSRLQGTGRAQPGREGGGRGVLLPGRA